MVFSSIPQQQQQQDCEKKLDLNAPLMSVRRHGILHLDTATTTTSSSDDEQQQQQWASPRSDLYTSWEAGGGADMRSPGAVPFMWERTPGRPKLEPGDEHRAVACSPSLPPGRMPSPSRCSDPRRGAPPLGNGGVLVAQQQQQQQKQAMDGARKALLPFLLKESQHRKHKQSSLAQLFKRKAAVTPTSASASASDEQRLQQREEGEDEEEDDEDGFSDAQQSEHLTGMSLDPATTHNNSNNPAAERDFIMRRFLPAAKAMADESSSSPFSSPILSSSALNQQQQQHNQKNKKNLPSSSPSSFSPRQQVSASVERIQDGQYKFSSTSSSSRDVKLRRTADDDFAMKACGFFSFGLLRHLRPNYPSSSRLRRASDRTNNRFASDDFQSSILVNKVKDGLTIRAEAESSEGNQTEAEEDRPKAPQQPLRHFGRTDYKQLKSPNRLLDSPIRETFYDCDTSFFNRSQLLFSPQKVKTPERMNPPTSPYYRGSMSPSANNHLEAKGFLGLPENYKPPEDPYRNAGYSPRNGYLSSKRSTSNSELEIERKSSMATRNQSFLAKRVGKDLWLNTEDSNLGVLNFESSSPASRNGAPEESSELGWKMNNAKKINGSPAVVTNAFGSNQGTSPRKQAELNGRGWPTLKTAILDNSTGVPALSPAAAAAPLLPPKSPTQSWLGKSLPFASSHDHKAKWEATVKSRQLRPGHLRYSEENALQPCEY